MGQYYKAVIANAKGVKVADSWKYGNGAKLMEHSWMGNDFVNAVLTAIEDTPSRVCWVGDYATDVIEEPTEMMAFALAWQSEAFELNIMPKPLMCKDGETFGEGYLVNHTMAQYIDLAQYAELAKVRDGYMKGFIANPLPILTAVGNGLGGGDYRGSNMEMVGYWRMNLLEYTQTPPSDYGNITEEVVFKEA